MLIKYNNVDCQFLENNAMYHKLPNGQEYFYFPFYLRKVGDGIFEEISFDKLPQDLKDKFINERECRLIETETPFPLNLDEIEPTLSQLMINKQKGE